MASNSGAYESQVQEPISGFKKLQYKDNDIMSVIAGNFSEESFDD